MTDRKENTAAGLVESGASVERVLLLVTGDRDRDLLVDRLNDRYEVVVGTPRDEWDRFDLCVVDAATYRSVQADLAARKRTTATYLPVLLLVPDQDRARQAEWLVGELGKTVDDVIVVPTPKSELDARVKALLRARRQSKTLALYRRAMDEATIGITITDPNRPDNPIVYANDGFLRLTGYDREEVLGRNCRFLQGPDTDAAPVRELREAIDAETSVTVELLNYRADGEPFWNRVTVTPIRDDGDVTHYLGFQDDITENVRVRKRFRALVRTATDAIVIVNADNTIVYANEAVERVFGYPPEAVEGNSLTTLMPARFREKHRIGLQRYLATGERSLNWEQVRFPGLHADGHQVPLEISFAEFEATGGRLFAGIIRDVTERKELEDGLRTETELLERVFDTSPVGIIVLNTAGDIVRANETAEEELGLERSEIVARTYDDPAWEIVDLDGKPVPAEDLPFDRVMRTGEPVEDYRHGIRVDDEERWLSVNAAPLTDEDGNIEHVVSAVQDITDRVNREHELEQYETIIQTATEPVFVLDAEGRFVRVNDAMVEMTGYPREELVGSHVSLVADGSDVRRAEDHLKKLLAGEHDRATFETSLLTTDGGRREYVISMGVLRDAGTFKGTVVIAHDVTDLHEHQRRLSVLDRVLRHNLRNKLNIVLAHAESIANETDDAGLGEHARTIVRASNQLLELGEQARLFEESIDPGRKENLPRDIAELIEEVVDAARTDYPEADVVADLPGEVWARAPNTLELALAELIENAVKHNDRAHPTVRVAVTTEADEVVVHVADDGPGFDGMERRALLRGTETPLEHTQGLGLWLVRWTAAGAGGDFDITANAPRGSIVTVRLPRAAPVSSAGEAERLGPDGD